MALSFFRRKHKAAPRSFAPNPYKNPKVRSGFFSTDVNRLLSGWDTHSNSIDFYLESELRTLRTRSRKMVRQNPYGKRFVNAIKSNVVGPSGVVIQSQTMRRSGVLDSAANDALEAAFKDWAEFHCDYQNRSNWVDLQNMAIACAAQDGEFVFIKHNTGKYGFQLQSVDPELLDVGKNETTKSGGIIRLGVEYNTLGRGVRYHFRKPDRQVVRLGYTAGESYSLPASRVIHGFISEWPDQSRGAPWMHASLERSKHLEKYDEAAIVNARATASTMAILHSKGDDTYTGEEEGDEEGVTVDQYEAGTIKDIGNREISQLDPDYPHQMYSDFVKSQLRAIASGLGVSYHSLSNDLEGVNYSSIRAGVLEDREIFKGIQNWFIRALVAPVYRDWIDFSYMKGALTIGSTRLSRPPADYHAAHYQPRRWAWVDPQKDGAANQQALENRTKSHSQIMREAGDDPESVWREIARDHETMRELGIEPTYNPAPATEEVTDNDEV